MQQAPSSLINTRDDESHWQATLTLDYQRRETKTQLVRRRHCGPLVVQKPFYPESNGTCHTYIIHPPGGIVGGDHLTLDVRLQTNSAALLTTPGAGKFYRSDAKKAMLRLCFSLQSAACLEWLPQETICYRDCHAQIDTEVHLAENADFIAWDIYSYGRPASDEVFDKGSCRQRLTIWREGNSLYIDRVLIDGQHFMRTALWGLQSYPVMASLVAVNCELGVRDKIRHLLSELDNPPVSVSLLQDVLVCRYLGASVMQAKAIFLKIWCELRYCLLNKPACVPRIWMT